MPAIELYNGCGFRIVFSTNFIRDEIIDEFEKSKITATVDNFDIIFIAESPIAFKTGKYCINV
jgi:hypothetical protein